MSEAELEKTIFQHGAEWVRADFHLHTKEDKQFKFVGQSDFYNSSYVDALDLAGIRVGVVTNHNKFKVEEFKGLQKTAKKRGICLLPGVELSVSEGKKGLHVLVVFSGEWLSGGSDYIHAFLQVAFSGKVPAEFEHEDGRTSMSLSEAIKKLEEFGKDYFIVFAHVEQPCGLWQELGGGRLKDFSKEDWFKRRVLGFQKVTTRDSGAKGEASREKVRLWMGDAYPAEVEGSDPKSLEQIGKGESCFIKIGDPSYEAVKFALFDHKQRVRRAPPAPRNAAILKTIRFEGGAMDGSEISLSPSLNCLIGPRGNGKSAVVESIRYALGFDAESDDRYKNGLVGRILSPAGKVIVECVDEFDRSIRVEREQSGRPSVFVDDKYHEVSPDAVLKNILYFGQKDLSNRSESFDESFLDKLLADRLDSKPAEEARLKEAVRQAANQLKESIDATEKLAAAEKERNELEVQMQVYIDKGVDKKLEEMTLFDVDRQSIGNWKENIENCGNAIDDCFDWSVLTESFPELKSSKTESVRAKLIQIRQTIDAANVSVSQASKQIVESLKRVGEVLEELEPVQLEIKNEVAALQTSLNEPLLDLELFRKKKARFEQLEKLIRSANDRAKTESVARDLLGAAVNNLHEFWRTRFIEREREVRDLEKDLPKSIRFKTSFKGKRKSFEEFLRTIFRGSGLQANTYETLQKRFVDGRELYQSRSELDTVVSEIASAKVKSALHDNLVDFLLFRTPDETSILYQGKALGDYSLGQRATVILHILMHLRRHPVILIDQPEDDLDNETLYSHFIHQLIKRKDSTQFIFATHNANIPVLGDAEQVIVCRNESGKFSFEHGSIDSKAIQGRIVTVMEGGEDAFRRRREIYQLWKSSN